MKGFLRSLLIVVVALVLLAGALYQFFGLRVVLDGSGTPRLAFVESADARAAAIERHRASQQGQRRTTSPPVESPRGETVTEPARAAADPRASEDAGPSPAVTRGAETAATIAVSPDTTRESYWTGFRGPARDGHYRELPILTAWPVDGLTPIWKQPAGGGYASFAVARGRAFTIEQRRTQEVVVAYDVANGRELWTHAWDGEFREFMGGDGPRATPTWSNGLVYALGALGELRCLDETTGRLVWRRNILADNGATNLQWGMAASPLIVDETVIVLPGGPGGRSVAAYDRRTGAPVWSALDDKQAYVSPMLATLAGRRQLLVVSARRMMGLTPDRGELLWELPWVTEYDINAAQPLVVGDDGVFISSGYGRGAALLQIAREGDGFSPRESWRTTRMKNRFNSSVLHEGFIYGLDEGILACIDVQSGEAAWKGGRYGYGQVVLASGHLIVLTEDGDLALVRATPERHEELVRFPVLDGKTWNHPALAGGRLLVRNLEEMAAFDLRVRR
jgi:outer membrane protein assembly factor BamB